MNEQVAWNAGRYHSHAPVLPGIGSHSLFRRSGESAPQSVSGSSRGYSSSRLGWKTKSAVAEISCRESVQQLICARRKVWQQRAAGFRAERNLDPPKRGGSRKNARVARTAEPVGFAPATELPIRRGRVGCGRAALERRSAGDHQRLTGGADHLLRGRSLALARETGSRVSFHRAHGPVVANNEAIPQGMVGRGSRAGGASVLGEGPAELLAQTFFEAWERQISRSSLLDLLSRCTTARLRFGCVASNDDHMVALTSELETDFSLQPVLLRVPSLPGQDALAPERLEEVDLVVTSVFHVDLLVQRPSRRRSPWSWRPFIQNSRAKSTGGFASVPSQRCTSTRNTPSVAGNTFP